MTCSHALKWPANDHSPNHDNIRNSISLCVCENCRCHKKALHVVQVSFKLSEGLQLQQCGTGHAICTYVLC